MALVRFLSQKELPTFSTKLIELIASNVPSAIQVIAAIVFGLSVFLLKPKIKPFVGDSNFLRNLSSLFLNIILFLMLLIGTYSQQTSLRFSNIQSFFIMREAFLLVMALVWIGFLFEAIKYLLQDKPTEKENTQLQKLTGKIKGFAFYVHESSILGKVLFNRRYEFLIVELDNKKEVHLLMPKTNLFFFENSNFCPGDEIEFYGYEMISRDLNRNDGKDLVHYTPIILRLAKRSELRRFT